MCARNCARWDDDRRWCGREMMGCGWSEDHNKRNWLTQSMCRLWALINWVIVLSQYLNISRVNTFHTDGYEGSDRTDERIEQVVIYFAPLDFRWTSNVVVKLRLDDIEKSDVLCCWKDKKVPLITNISNNYCIVVEKIIFKILCSRKIRESDNF